MNSENMLLVYLTSDWGSYGETLALVLHFNCRTEAEKFKKKHIVFDRDAVSYLLPDEWELVLKRHSHYVISELLQLGEKYGIKLSGE